MAKVHLADILAGARSGLHLDGLEGLVELGGVWLFRFVKPSTPAGVRGWYIRACCTVTRAGLAENSMPRELGGSICSDVWDGSLKAERLNLKVRLPLRAAPHGPVDPAMGGSTAAARPTAPAAELGPTILSWRACRQEQVRKQVFSSKTRAQEQL